jgi:hypothetical protein
VTLDQLIDEALAAGEVDRAEALADQFIDPLKYARALERISAHERSITPPKKELP